MSVNSVAHAIKLVELLSQHLEGLGVSAIAARLELPRPTVYRLLSTLMEAGWCSRTDNAYMLSPRMMALANGCNRLAPLMDTIHALLHRLASETGETAHFAVLDGAGITYIAKVESSHPIRMFSHVGWHGPVHATGVGKALLACAPQALVDRVLSGPLHRYTESTITTAAGLAQELTRIRQRGYAIDREELIDGLVCKAIAVSNGKELLGAFSIAGPKDRMRDNVKAFEHLTQAARGLLQVVGARD